MVFLINSFTLTASPEKFEEVFEESAVFMRNQPGFIRHTLAKSLRNSNSYVNIAQWEDAQSHIRVVQSPEFRVHIDKLAAVARSEPDLYAIVQDVAHADR